MAHEIRITACDNELYLVAYRGDASYRLAHVQSGNNKPVDLVVHVDTGDYLEPPTYNGVYQPIKGEYRVRLPRGSYSILPVYINWGGPAKFAFTLDGKPYTAGAAGLGSPMGLTIDGSAAPEPTSRPDPERAAPQPASAWPRPVVALPHHFGYWDRDGHDGWRVDRHPRLLADLSGDKCADIVAFGPDGVYAARNRGDGTFANPQLMVRNFNYDGGWRTDKHPRFVADLTGDGRADILGIADWGVMVSLNQGNGTFADPQHVLAEYGGNNGNWRQDHHPRLLADLTGDGCPDLLGFGYPGVFVSPNRGNGTFAGGQFVLHHFGYDQGWRVELHPRLLADLTGDGRADIVGFASEGVYVALNKGDGTFTDPQPVLQTFGYNHGWRVGMHPRFVVDLTGDGRADILGFGKEGVYVALGKGDGGFAEPQLVLPSFGYDGLWRIDMHPRCLADLTGDGRPDILGFGKEGVYVALNKGDGTFAEPLLVVKELGYDSLWRVEKHPRLLADLDGDGRADILAFADSGVYACLTPPKESYEPDSY